MFVFINVMFSAGSLYAWFLGSASLAEPCFFPVDQLPVALLTKGLVSVNIEKEWRQVVRDKDPQTNVSGIVWIGGHC